MMNLLKNIAHNGNPDSMASKMRKARFKLFLDLLEGLEKPISILDVGGTQAYWETMGVAERSDIHVTLLNLEASEVKYSNFKGVSGDATSMPEFLDNQFDVVYSNSVIEHVGNYSNQCLMAKEVQRVGCRYFIQTPNYYFPLEPHFHFIGFQWLPACVRVVLIRRFDLGWFKKIPELKQAEELIESIHLMTKKRFSEAFPGSTLCREKVIGLTKSFMVHSGW